MRVIYNKSTSPYFNLALEEQLLTGAQDDIFMLWRNSRAVIVGRNQNTHAEIDYDFVRENSIPVVRRLTGGGAVFHDLGNVNYTFITKSSDFNNYARFCSPIIEALAGMNVAAELSGRNDLLIDGRKFSGNAQCSHAGRLMHHGTLMFSANVDDMASALRVNPLKIQSKGIKSVRSRVTNISEHLPEDITVEQFIQRLLDYAAVSFGCAPEEPSPDEISGAKALEKEKYSLWEWNFGFRKEYAVKKETLTPRGLFDVRLNIAQDIITEIRIFGDYFALKDIGSLESALIGTRYDPQSLDNALSVVGEFFPDMTAGEMLKLIL